MGRLNSSLSFALHSLIVPYARSLTSLKPLPAAGIYIHIPFCRRRCFYCDFPVSVIGESDTLRRTRSLDYTELIMAEIETQGRLLSNSNAVNVDSIYFGGGTPSLLLDECKSRVIHSTTSLHSLCSFIGLHKIVSKVKTVFNVLNNAEITLEADPGTFDSSRLASFHNSGFNRLSVGVQSFNDVALKSCGRAHDVASTYRALEAIHKSPFDNFSIDLISSLPHLSIDQWQETIQAAIDAQSTHISVYDLQVEEKTAFGKWYSPGVFPLPNEELSSRMYETCVSTLTKAGFEHYEVSNYAKSGFRSRHNQKYWQCVPTFAFGLGAASYLGRHRYTRPAKMKEYAEWVQSIKTNPSLYAMHVLGKDSDEASKLENVNTAFSLASQPKPDLLDFVMLSLRTADGLDMNHLRSAYGEDIADKVAKASSQYLQTGIMREKDSWLRLSDPEGFLLSNDVISSIFAVIG